MATNSNPLLFVSAGEASGDAYGAALIRALQQRIPGARFTGLGGAQMEAAGQQRVVRAEDVAVMGVTEILRHIPKIYASYRRLVASIRRQRPDVAVLIDFPDVNFRLARHLKRAGVPVVWFVSPQLWAWKRGRLRWVQQRVDRMMVIFPFEEAFYRARGVEAEFVGHPLTELAPITQSREDYAAQHGLDPEKTWIALLPGSRWKEIRANLPALHELAVADLISTQASHTTFDGQNISIPAEPLTRYEFLLPVASTIARADMENYVADLDAESLRYFSDVPALPNRSRPQQGAVSALTVPRARLTLVDDARAALHHARASVVASGTATVLAALAGNPFVVVYRVSPLTFALAKKLVEYPEEMRAPLDSDGNLPVGMVNLIAGWRLVPELLQGRFTAQNVATELSKLLPDGPEREAQMRGLKAVRDKLESHPGESAIERVADSVVRLLGA